MEIESQHRKPALSSTVRRARIAHLTNGDHGMRNDGDGFFSAWQLYVEGDLQKFIAKTFSEGTYLAGQGDRNVKFYDNRPPGLTDGKAIVATPAERLTPKSVKTVNDGHLVVQAESWSAQQ
jgi:hypothetical protein